MKALKFQYEKQLKEIRVENARLQNELSERENLLKICGTANQELRQELSQASLEVDSKTMPEPELVESPYHIEIPSFDTDRSVYKRALEHFEAKNFNQSTLLLEQLVREFPKSHFADNAIYLMAEIYMIRGEPQLAEVEYLRLLEAYPKSERRAEAIQRLQSMGDDLAQARRRERSDSPSETSEDKKLQTTDLNVIGSSETEPSMNKEPRQ